MLFQGKIMNNNTRILIHWTGKDICTNHEDLTDDLRSKYLDRLKSIINDGFWMMPNNEKIIGFGGCINHSFQFCTCFTDLGVNNSAEHIKTYGLIGVGVTREYILRRDGRPVWYFLNDPTDIHAETINKLFGFIQKNMNNNPEIQQLYFRMSMLFDYAKPLGKNGTTLDEYYAEKEWRVVWNSHIANNLFIPTFTERPKFLMPLPKEDLKVIIFPDEKLKVQFYQDPYFHAMIKNGYSPSLISWEEYFNLMK
jgi:hypothetical protein